MAKQYKYFRSTFYYKGVQYSSTGKTQREADQKAALKEDKMKRGEIGISPNMTLKRWGDQWLKTYRKTKVIDKVYNDYKSQLENYLYPELGSTRLVDIKDIQLQEILNSMSHLSFSSVSKFRILLRGMFKQARISRLIVFDPAEALQMPKVKKGSSRAITDFERKHILKVAEYHTAGLFIKTMLYTGVRPAEARALTWNNVDLKNKYIYVRQSFESGKEKIKSPKTDAGVRDIPISDFLYYDLVKAKEQRLDTPFVFTQQTNTRPHTSSSLYKLWRSFRKELDISMGAVYGKKKAKDGKMREALLVSVVAEDLSLNNLRHTFCTDLEAQGVSINIAKTLMGHSDISVTSKIYTHTESKALENARALINKSAKKNNDTTA